MDAKVELRESTSPLGPWEDSVLVYEFQIVRPKLPARPHAKLVARRCWFVEGAYRDDQVFCRFRANASLTPGAALKEFITERERHIAVSHEKISEEEALIEGAAEAVVGGIDV